MLDLVQQLSRELASCALDYARENADVLDLVGSDELAGKLEAEARAWIQRRPALRVLLRGVVR